MKSLLSLAFVCVITASAICQCPLKTDPVDGSQPLPAIHPVVAGAKFISGTVLDSKQAPVTGKVQVCVDGTAAGGQQPVAVDGSFVAAPVGAIAAGQTVRVQFFNAAGGDPGPVAAFTVAAVGCSAGLTAESPTSATLIIKADGSFSGTVPGQSDGDVTICNHDALVPKIAAALVGSGGVYSGSGLTLMPGDSYVAFYGAKAAAAGVYVNQSAVQSVLQGPIAIGMVTPSKNAGVLEAEDQAIREQEAACTPNHTPPCLKNVASSYRAFQSDASAAINAATTAAPGQRWQKDYYRLTLQGLKDIDAGKFSFTPRPIVTHARVLTGVDVSAASSADPSARFLLDAALDVPISGGEKTTGLNANSWLWGYARLSSIAQPGAISGASAPSTYVSALIGSSPNAIVQSFEAAGGYEYHPQAATFDNTSGQRPILFSFIAEAGVITPLSDTQATPSVYIASPQVQSYYLSQAASNPSAINMLNASALAGAGCPAPSSAGALPAATPVCYIAQYPEQRSRFFRNYSAGFRVKRYYFNETDNNYIFPANFDFTLGQNDYVTAGELHHFVIHFGGSTPLPASISALQGLYVYAYADMELSKSNIPAQQFLLLQAPGTITTSSSSVASIIVGQPDRDRYRFGIAYDLATLLKKLKPPS